ncbi:MAG: hypothetical protein Cons2KO_33620 [Congregibacter sp.]
MSIRSHSIVSRELKQLRSFYETTRSAYDKVQSIQNLAADSPGLERSLTDGGVRWSKLDKRIRTDNRKKSVEAILRELIFVRAISALETFLTDAIRDIFVVTKTPFMDKSARIEFSQEDLIANNTPTQIYTRIIERETRRLTSGGFNEFIKYYKKRFEIDLASIDPGYKIMNEYHDIRHILVHRLGHTDDAFRRKYRVDVKQIQIEPSLLDSFLSDLDVFVNRVASEVRALVDSYATSDTGYNARYIVDILPLAEELPACLYSSFQYWADDEYVMMSDVLLGTTPADEGRVRYYFNASDRALRYLQRHLRKEQRRGSISVLDVSASFRYEKKSRLVTEEVISAVQAELPEQPWPKGVHKDIARRLGLSNGKVSDAIDVLIFRREFKDQVDGKIID